MELKLIILWVLDSGGAGAIAYFLIDRVKGLAELAAVTKRYVAIGISSGVAMLIFWVATQLAYLPAPTTRVGWFEQLVFYATSAFLSSQIIHAKLDLPRKIPQ